MAPVPTLKSIPAPGLVVCKGYTALNQECFVLKESRKHFRRRNVEVWFKDTATGRLGGVFMEIDEGKDRRFYFTDGKNGGPVFTIERERHTWSPDIYIARDHTGAKMWQLEVSVHSFKPDDYVLTLLRPKYQVLSLQKKLQNKERELRFNGAPAMSIDEPPLFGHMRREECVHVAQGMDRILGIGVAFVRYYTDTEKQNSSGGGAGFSITNAGAIAGATAGAC